MNNFEMKIWQIICWLKGIDDDDDDDDDELKLDVWTDHQSLHWQWMEITFPMTAYFICDMH